MTRHPTELLSEVYIYLLTQRLGGPNTRNMASSSDILAEIRDSLAEHTGHDPEHVQTWHEKMAELRRGR